LPHYKDGTPAKPGDIIRGTGYNIKDEDGQLQEIVGVLLAVNPNTDVCNVTILIPEEFLGNLSPTSSGTALGGKSGALLAGKVEYGQADHFELVDAAVPSAV
jgi:hypothetical protein